MHGNRVKVPFPQLAHAHPILSHGGLLRTQHGGSNDVDRERASTDNALAPAKVTQYIEPQRRTCLASRIQARQAPVQRLVHRVVVLPRSDREMLRWFR
jgi:hypothetical protein